MSTLIGFTILVMLGFFIYVARELFIKRKLYMFLVLWLQTFALTIGISAFFQDVKSSDFAELIYIFCGLLAPLAVLVFENKDNFTNNIDIPDKFNKLKSACIYILSILIKHKYKAEEPSQKEYFNLQPIDKLSSENTEGYIVLGDEYLTAGLYAESAECYKRYVEVKKTSTEGYLKLGISQENMGESEEAIRAYKKSVHLNPEFIEGYIYLGRCYCSISNYNAAIEMYKDAINKNPFAYTLYYHLGIACEMCKRYPEAVKAYEMALEINPTDEEIIYHLGAVLIELRKYDEAISAYKSALQAKTSDYELFYNLSIVYSLIQKPDIAIENLKKAVELNKGLIYSILNNKAFDNIRSYPEFRKVIG